MNAQDIQELMRYLTPAEREELDEILASDKATWRPLPGPQHMAYNSDADIIGFGGSAGGGKTDLACGKALTQHRNTMMLRRVGTELTAIIDRLAQIKKTRDGFNGRDNIWRTTRDDGVAVQIEFGAVPNVGDEVKYQGRPHDLLVFDEAANFLASQVRFLMGWLRTSVPGQRCQALLTFNPPTTAEGRWIIDFFAPWLDKKYPNPAKPGELRFAASLPADETHPNGRDIWVKDGRPFVLVNGEPVYDFDPDQYTATDIIRPLSRTFIPSRVTDNPYLMSTGYISTLQALPEPLRSQMLKGDFHAGIEDDPWQVIPTAWIEAAQARWVKPAKLPPMDSVGVDVARGGKDNFIIARRHGTWFDEPLVYPGSQTPTGPAGAGLVIAATRDNAPQHVDVIGVGSATYDFLIESHQQAIGVNVAEKSLGTDKSGRLRFKNLRSELAWMFREFLDPSNNTGAALPPDPRLLADLSAYKWRLEGSVIYVESREEIIKRIGRSPDWGSAYFLALIDTPKIAHMKALRVAREGGSINYDPMAAIDSAIGFERRDYDPLSMI